MNKIKINSGDYTVEFRLPQILEFTKTVQDEESDALIGWLEREAQFVHKNEYEYIFPLVPDTRFMKKLNPPDALTEIFLAALKHAQQADQDAGTVYLLIYVVVE